MVKRMALIGALIMGVMAFSVVAYADETVSAATLETTEEQTEETTEHVFVYADENDEVGDDSADNPPMRGEANTTPTWGRTKEVEDMLKQWQEEDATKVYRDPGDVAFYTEADKKTIPVDCIMISLVYLDEQDLVYVAIERDREFFTSESIPAGKYYINDVYAWDKERGVEARDKGSFTAKAFTNGKLCENNTFEVLEGSNNSIVEVYLNNSDGTALTQAIPDKVETTSSEIDDIDSEIEVREEDGEMVDFGKYFIPAACIAIVIIAGVAISIKCKKYRQEDAENSKNK